MYSVYHIYIHDRITMGTFGQNIDADLIVKFQGNHFSERFY